MKRCEDCIYFGMTAVGWRMEAWCEVDEELKPCIHYTRKMKATKKQLERALELMVLDYINDGPREYCRDICKADYCTPKREGKCQKQIAVHFIRKAKEAK